MQVVDAYVQRTRGWNRSDYRIEELERRSGLIIFTVTNVEDERNPVPGRGKSFVAHYDMRLGQVVKELAYQ